MEIKLTFFFKKAEKERITIISNYIKIVFTISGNELTELQKKSTIISYYNNHNKHVLQPNLNIHKKKKTLHQ